MEPKFLDVRGNNKLLLQFKRFTETKSFNREIIEIRKFLGIPLEGKKLTEKELENINEYIKFPEDDEFRYVLCGMRLKRVSDYPEAVEHLLSMFPVMTTYFELIIRNYIHYNVFLYKELEQYAYADWGICTLSDAEFDESKYLIDEDPEMSFSLEGHNKNVIKFTRKYPVSIKIHQEASQNDVIDYIKKNWSVIKGLQGKYQNEDKFFSLKNSKTKENLKLKKRNDFIYENRNLPRREIMKMVNRDFGADLDQGSIGKIISLECKKREKK